MLQRRLRYIIEQSLLSEAQLGYVDCYRCYLTLVEVHDSNKPSNSTNDVKQMRVDIPQIKRIDKLKFRTLEQSCGGDKLQRSCFARFENR